jgi:acetyl-CoA C-acetyltransferase
MQAYLLDAIRTPRGKGNDKGRLHEVKPVVLLKGLFDELARRAPVAPESVSEVILGCVTQVGDQGGNIAQTASLYAGWEPLDSATTVNSFCTSSLSALGLATAKVAARMGDLYAVGGIESMSRVPLMSDRGALFVDQDISPHIPYVPNGVIADFFASRNGFSREDLDQYAARSHNRAQVASEESRFARSLIPVRDSEGGIVLGHDELVRGNASPESLKKLNPLFAELGAGGFNRLLLDAHPDLECIAHHHHAGNAPGMVDGASLGLIGSPAAAERLGLPMRARIRALSYKRGPAIEGLTGGLMAARDALQKANLTSSDIDLWEFNEGFAGVVMHCASQLGIDDDRLNVNGGGIAMGHAMGATGINLLSTLADELERRDLNTGVVAISGAAGIGAAVVIDRDL